MASQSDIESDKDLQAKIQLEKTFRRSVVSVFNTTLNDFKVTYSATGHLPVDGKYNSHWEIILKKFYNIVQKRFTRKVRLITKQIEHVEDDDNIEALLLLALLTWRDENSKRSAKLIGITTSKQMRQAIAEARDMLEEQNEPTDKRSIAATATKILKGKFKKRINNILLSETQNVAEATKHITGEHIQRAIIEDEQLRTEDTKIVTKKWRTVGDSRVRLTHQIANGQERLLTEPFIVGGQLLMNPGDSSLGAHAKETSGCRCSSILFVLGKIVTFHNF